MNLDELRVELREAADLEGQPSDAAVTEFLRREGARRTHRRWGLVGASALLALVVAGGVLWRDNGSTQIAVETPNDRTAAGGRPGKVPSVRLDLPSRTLTAGGNVTVSAVVSNRTGHPVRVAGCGSPFAAVLGNAAYQQATLWTLCRTLFTFPTGNSAFPVVISTSYSECSTHGENGWPPCLGAAGTASLNAPLPDGKYQLTLRATEGLDIQLPAPMTITVTTTACATEGELVTAPNVIGKRLPVALRLIRRSGLNVVGFGTFKTDPTTRSARVIAEEPSGGEMVPRGSCVGLRTQ